MNEIIINVGISGSGKSTWSKEYIRNTSGVLRINRDDIRTTLVGNLTDYYSRKDLHIIERNVTRTEEFLFKNLYIDKYDVIIDNTNLKQNYINQWNKMASVAGYTTMFKLFDISLEEAQRRVTKRENMQTFEDLCYIDKQYQDYINIKKWIVENYKDKIIK